jgi:hypothetical protein
MKAAVGSTKYVAIETVIEACARKYKDTTPFTNINHVSPNELNVEVY